MSGKTPDSSWIYRCKLCSKHFQLRDACFTHHLQHLSVPSLEDIGDDSSMFQFIPPNPTALLELASGNRTPKQSFSQLANQSFEGIQQIFADSPEDSKEENQDKEPMEKVPHRRSKSSSGDYIIV